MTTTHLIFFFRKFSDQTIVAGKSVRFHVLRVPNRDPNRIKVQKRDPNILRAN